RAPQEQTSEPVGVETTAEFLWRNLITPFGRSADACREQVRSLPGVTPDAMVIAGQTFGLFALTWPRRTLVERTARWICFRMLEKWLSSDSRLVQPAVHHWLQQQWQEQQCSPDILLACFQQTCEQILGKNFEAFVTSLTDPLTPKSRWSRTT